MDLGQQARAYIETLSRNPNIQRPQDAASNIGKTFGAGISPQEYLPALEKIYGPGQNWDALYGKSGGGSGYGTNYNSQALAAINKSMNTLNEREGAAMTNLEREFAGQKRTLQANVQTGQENLKRQTETTTRQKNQGLRELSQNIRNAYQSGMTRLGTSGAADSSAAKMYQFALGQQEGENRGQLISDYNYNIGNIELKTKQLERDFQTKLAALDSWKQTQAFTIRDRFLEARDRLEQQRASLGGAYVSQATAQLAQQAAGDLANLSDQVGSAANIIQNDFATAEASLRELSRNNMNPNVGLREGVQTGTVAPMTALYRRQD